MRHFIEKLTLHVNKDKRTKYLNTQREKTFLPFFLGEKVSFPYVIIYSVCTSHVVVPSYFFLLKRKTSAPRRRRIFSFPHFFIFLIFSFFSSQIKSIDFKFQKTS